MPARARPQVLRPLRRWITPVTLVLASCVRDPASPAPSALGATSAAVHGLRRDDSSAPGTYDLGQEDGGVVWTLYPAQNAVGSTAGDYIELSPEIAAYLAHFAQRNRLIAEHDSAMAEAAAARGRDPLGPCGTKRVCQVRLRPDPAFTRSRDRLGSGTRGGFTGGGFAAPTVVPGDSAGGDPGQDPPPPAPGSSGPPSELRTVGVDMGANGGDGGPGQMCRDIVDAWGRQQAGYAAASSAYSKAAATLFGAVTGLLGTTRFDPVHVPDPDPTHPSTESVREFLKSFKDVKELGKWVGLRYGPQVAALEYDSRASDLMNAQIQRSVYATLFNSYDCPRVLAETAPPPVPQPPPGGGGGGPTNKGPQWCYYQVWLVNGSEVSRNFLGCW